MYKRKRSVKQESGVTFRWKVTLHTSDVPSSFENQIHFSLFSFSNFKIKYRREQEVSKGLGIVFDGNQQHWANIRDFRKRTTVRIELLINQATYQPVEKSLTMVCLTIERPTGENEEVFGFFQPHSTTVLPFDTKTFNNIEGKNY